MEYATAIKLLNKKHPFTLPSPGDVIIHAETGVEYTIQRPIDQGSYGHVFLCTDTWRHELVAKVLKPIGDVNEMEMRAETEVVASAIVRSPHIVHVHAAFVYRGGFYIVSERCAMSLRDLMEHSVEKRRVWFPALMDAVLKALHFMHSQSIAHCDIHSGNVLLHCKPDVLLPREHLAFDFKLGDFGQARSISNMVPSATWNPSCMPPEVLDSEEFGPIDKRADIYQAGLLFLRFLSPSPLEFDASDIRVGRPREIAEALPHAVGEGLARMLRRHAAARTSSALQAWIDLDNLLLTQ